MRLKAWKLEFCRLTENFKSSCCSKKATREQAPYRKSQRDIKLMHSTRSSKKTAMSYRFMQTKKST